MRDSARTPPEAEDPTALRLLVEIVYDPGCPNVDEARGVLTRALQEANVPAVWTEWDTEDPECPENRKGYGSPTILVNGEDVAPGPHQWSTRYVGSGPRSRLYREGAQTLGAPPLARVQAAIHGAMGPDVV